MSATRAASADSGDRDVSAAQSYFDEAAASIMQRVKSQKDGLRQSRSSSASSSRTTTTKKTATTTHARPASSTTPTATRAKTNSGERQHKFHRDSQSQDICGWLQMLGMQHMASKFEDLGVIEVRDFWLVESSDLLEAGFSPEQVRKYHQTLEKLDAEKDAPDSQLPANNVTEAKQGPESKEATIRPVQSAGTSVVEMSSASSAPALAADEIPDRMLSNLQEYFPTLSQEELLRTLQNLDGNFDRAMMLLTGLYPDKRVAEPDIKDITGVQTKSTRPVKVAKFPVPPMAVENLGKKFPHLATEEIEEALRHNKLNFVKSVDWLTARELRARIAAGSATNVVKMLQRQDSHAEAIVPFVNRLAKQFPTAGRHHVEEALRISKNNYSKAQQILHSIYSASAAPVEQQQAPAPAAVNVKRPEEGQPTSVENGDTFGKVTNLLMPQLSELQQGFAASNGMLDVWLGDIDPSLSKFSGAFIEFGVEEQEDLKLVEKEDLQQFGLSDEQVDTFWSTVRVNDYPPTKPLHLDTGPRKQPKSELTVEEEHLLRDIAPRTPDISKGRGYDEEERSIIRDIVEAQSIESVFAQGPRKKEKQSSHSSERARLSAKELGLSAEKMAALYSADAKKKVFTIDDYYNLLNDLAPPSVQDGANFFDLVAPRLELSYRKQLADFIHVNPAIIPDLWGEFDHADQGYLESKDLRKLCKYFLTHLQWSIQKKSCWEGDLTQDILIKNMPSLFSNKTARKKSKRRQGSDNVRSEQLTGKKLADKILSIGGITGEYTSLKERATRAQFEAYFRLTFQQENELLSGTSAATSIS